VTEVVGDPTVLSMDVDNDDYLLWLALETRPDVVVIEINSGVAPMSLMIPGRQGASYRSMAMLGMAKGYMLVAHTGNMIFVLEKYRDLFPEVTGDPIRDYELYFNTMHL